jgi:hypothetical protein
MSKKSAAVEFLTMALQAGPAAATEVVRMARAHGVTERSVRAAREELQVEIERRGFGPAGASFWAVARAHR